MCMNPKEDLCYPTRLWAQKKLCCQLKTSTSINQDPSLQKIPTKIPFNNGMLLNLSWVA